MVAVGAAAAAAVKTATELGSLFTRRKSARNASKVQRKKKKKKERNQSAPPPLSSSTQIHSAARDSHPPLPPNVATASASLGPPPTALELVSPALALHLEPKILFLEQEYLVFRLGNPDASTSDFSDSDTDSLSSNYKETTVIVTT